MKYVFDFKDTLYRRKDITLILIMNIKTLLTYYKYISKEQIEIERQLGKTNFIANRP